MRVRVCVLRGVAGLGSLAKEKQADGEMQKMQKHEVRGRDCSVMLAKDCILGFKVPGKNRSMFWYFLLYLCISV